MRPINPVFPAPGSASTPKLAALRRAGVCILLAALAGCGGGGSSSDSPPVNAAPVVAPIGEQSLAPGETTRIELSIADADAADRHVVQAISSDTSVATVLVGGTTITITAGGAGTATITVTATDNSGSANATSAAVTFTVTVAGWIEGVFEDASNFKNLCAVPRSGSDADGNAFPDRQGETPDENNWLRSWSNDTYLWFDEIEDRDPACCDTPTYFDGLKTFARTPSGNYKDRFHFTEDTARRRARVRSGVSAGYGVRFAILASRPPRLIRVAYTEPDSPATSDEANLLRGTTILAVDGVDVENGSAAALNAGLFPGALDETHEFTVLDPGASAERTVTMTSAAITTAPVQHVRVVETDGGPVGYFLFNTHIATAERALMDAIDELASAEVTDVVVDLRYNGGGYLAIASQLGYMLAGRHAQGQVFSELQFNNKHTVFDPVTGDRLRPDYFLSTATGWFGADAGTPFPALHLDRVFILAGPGTCSASESVINSLRGIDIDVVLIGATTCGKPYGFYPTDNCGTTYSTVQFRSVNAAGFGDYSDGFSPHNQRSPGGISVPGCSVPDDFDHPFGDPDEARLAAALGYRNDESCPVPPTAVAGAHSAVAGPDAVYDPSAASYGESIAATSAAM